MIRLQREKREQREKEEREKREKLKAEATPAAKEELAKMDRQQKLHVGNISKDKWSSSHEKSRPSASADTSKATSDNKVKVKAFEGESFADGYEAFLEANKAILLEYAAIEEEDEKSEQFVLANTQLLSEHATGYYLLHCINLQAEGKTREMRKMARQYLLLTYVCDLAKSMPGRDARDAIKPLFRKMLTNVQAAQAFDEHLEKYIAHVKTRAEVKKQEMAEGEGEEEYVALKKGEHIGPGGLDPAEVFETLPTVLQEAFGERDVEALKTALATLEVEDAQYHMQRCIDSGLWDPAGGGGGSDDA